MQANFATLQKSKAMIIKPPLYCSLVTKKLQTCDDSTYAILVEALRRNVEPISVDCTATLNVHNVNELIDSAHNSRVALTNNPSMFPPILLKPQYLFILLERNSMSIYDDNNMIFKTISRLSSNCRDWKTFRHYQQFLCGFGRSPHSPFFIYFYYFYCDGK